MWIYWKELIIYLNTWKNIKFYKIENNYRDIAKFITIREHRDNFPNFVHCLTVKGKLKFLLFSSVPRTIEHCLMKYINEVQLYRLQWVVLVNILSYWDASMWRVIIYLIKYEMRSYPQQKFNDLGMRQREWHISGVNL